MPKVSNIETSTLSKANIAEITNISPFGFWILVDDNEFFIDYKQYPAFYDARLSEINDFSVDAMGNFHWETLDADIEKEALEHPEKNPFIYTA